MKKLIFATLLTIFNTSPLADTRLAIGGWSHHYLWTDSITNGTHNILAVEHNGWSAGYFENSFGRDTFFVARSWRKNDGREHCRNALTWP